MDLRPAWGMWSSSSESLSHQVVSPGGWSGVSLSLGSSNVGLSLCVEVRPVTMVVRVLEELDEIRGFCCMDSVCLDAVTIHGMKIASGGIV